MTKPYPALRRDCKHSKPEERSAWSLRCTHPKVNASDPVVASLTLETADEARADRAHAEAYFRQAEKLLTANEQTLRAERDQLLEQLAAAQREVVELRAAIPAPEGAQAVLEDLFRQAIDWGRSYGQRLSLSDTQVSDVCQSFAAQALRAALAAPAPQDSLDSAQPSNLVAMQAAQAPAWQPIEMAPKDGTKVLVWFSELYGGMVDVALWSEDKFAKKPRPYWSGIAERIYGVRAFREGAPTHWMPLPAAPKTKEPTHDR